MHFITAGVNEGRSVRFSGLSYIAASPTLMLKYGADNDAGARDYISSGFSQGRQAAFDVSGYFSQHPNLNGRYASTDDFLIAYINTYASSGQFLV